MTARTTIDYQAKCEAPPEEFAQFAKGLLRGKKLNVLASSPAADLFAKRLIAEALSDQAHASVCLRLAGQLLEDSNWRDKVRAVEPTTDLPAPDQLRPKEVEPLGRLIRELFPEEVALAWIAFAYLSMKGAPRLRSPVEGLLFEAATTSNVLLDALSRGVAAIEVTANPIPKSVISRTIMAIEKFAEDQFIRSERASTRDFATIAARASRAELGRFVSAILSLRNTAGPGPIESDDANGEAAWVLADKDLARALQGAAALTHALDLARNVDSKVRGYAEIVAQAVESVAAKRELELQGVVGETTEYDPSVHQDDIGISPHSLVRIRRPAVVQGKQDPSIIKKAEIGPP